MKKKNDIKPYRIMIIEFNQDRIEDKNHILEEFTLITKGKLLRNYPINDSFHILEYDDEVHDILYGLVSLTGSKVHVYSYELLPSKPKEINYWRFSSKIDQHKYTKTKQESTI